jgi:tetratricopeptide (TPR) repeat protein
MKPIALIASCVVLSAGAAALTVRLLEPTRAADQAPPTEQLRERIQAQENELAALKKEVAEAKTKQTAVAAAPAERLSSSEIDAAVARWMEKHPAEASAAGAPTGAALTADKNAKKTDKAAQLAAFMAALKDKQKPRTDRHDIWKQIVDAGLIDDAVAAVEQMAKENPASADAQADLAHAYFEKLQTVNDGPEKGKWAIMADNTLDKALELDPNHWDARFTKAVGLSFWPPIFGKQGEAINQFEILEKQQEASGATNPDFSQTYVFLGNLYQQQGKADMAVQTWQKGASLFPDDGQLKKLIASANAGAKK